MGDGGSEGYISLAHKVLVAIVATEIRQRCWCVQRMQVNSGTQSNPSKLMLTLFQHSGMRQSDDLETPTVGQLIGLAFREGNVII